MARRFRISIASVMIVVVLLAIGFAGLRYPSHLWASALFTITIGLLLTAILGIACCREQQRAAWAGFATFGWSYLILCFAPWFDTEVGPYLLTTAVLELLYPKLAVQTALENGAIPVNPMPRFPKLPPAYGLGGGFGGPPPVAPPVPLPNAWQWWTSVLDDGGASMSGQIQLLSPEAYRRVGNCLATLLLAYLGSRIARALYATRTVPS
jgi:hypothetical protein